MTKFQSQVLKTLKDEIDDLKVSNRILSETVVADERRRSEWIDKIAELKAELFLLAQQRDAAVKHSHEISSIKDRALADRDAAHKDRGALLDQVNYLDAALRDEAGRKAAVWPPPPPIYITADRWNETLLAHAEKAEKELAAAKETISLFAKSEVEWIAACNGLKAKVEGFKWERDDANKKILELEGKIFNMTNKAYAEASARAQNCSGTPEELATLKETVNFLRSELKKTKEYSNNVVRELEHAAVIISPLSHRFRLFDI